MFKTIISAIAAILIAGAVFSLFLQVMHWAWSLLWELSVIIVIIIFALPIFVIFKKKIFK
jgi:hypothetical protein